MTRPGKNKMLRTKMKTLHLFITRPTLSTKLEYLTNQSVNDVRNTGSKDDFAPGCLQHNMATTLNKCVFALVQTEEIGGLGSWV